jgi:hypothetical protein
VKKALNDAYFMQNLIIWLKREQQEEFILSLAMALAQVAPRQMFIS